MTRVARTVLLGLSLLLGGAGAADLFRNDSLQEQVRALEVLPSRTPAQEQGLELLRSVLRHYTLQDDLRELLARSGVQFRAGDLLCPAGDQACTVRGLVVGGRRTPAEVEAALRAAGYRTEGGVRVEGPPALAPATVLSQTLPLRAEAVAQSTHTAGELLTAWVTLNNPLPTAESAGWIDLSAVLLNSEDEVVTWEDPPTSPTALGWPYGTRKSDCPARQACFPTPELSLFLTHFGTNTPLPVGLYRLRVQVRGLRVGDAPPLTFTLPDLPITVEAPNAR